VTPQAEAGDKTWSVGRYGVEDFPDYLVQPLITALCEVLTERCSPKTNTMFTYGCNEVVAFPAALDCGC